MVVMPEGWYRHTGVQAYGHTGVLLYARGATIRTERNETESSKRKTKPKSTSSKGQIRYSEYVETWNMQYRNTLLDSNQ